MYESGIAQMVERQWKKWLLLTQHRAGEKPLPFFPTITVSREKGSGGSSVGRLVAERLNFVVFDSEIVDEVARSASVDRLVVEHLDERSRHSIGEWTERILHRRSISPETYMAHLTKTIVTIGHKGRAVIIGRGAHLLLPAERCFRVRVVAPWEARVQRVAAVTGLERSVAENVVRETDQQRALFIQENFQQLDSNPLLFDLVINTGGMTLDTAAGLVIRGAEANFAHTFESPATMQHPAAVHE